MRQFSNPFPRTLIVCVGLPRSGKSAWARAHKPQYPIVCPDAIRLSLYGQPFIGPMEPYVWAIARTMVESLFESGHSHVILDSTNGTRERRDRWRDPRWELRFREFKVTAGECIRRAYVDRTDLVSVIQQMASIWEPLGPEDARW